MHGVLTRREFLGGLLAIPLAGAAFPSSVRLVDDPPASDLEREHQIRIRGPLLAHDGANVPLAVNMDHPMTPDHHIRKVGVYVFDDPLVTKAVFHLTPQVGAVSLMLQMRMNAGDHRVYVTAECSRHGVWAASRPLRVSVGGCHTVGEDKNALQDLGGSVAAPRLYAPETVRAGEIFGARIKVKHPSRTGLRLLADGKTFERAVEPFFVHTMEIFYGRTRLRPRLVARVEMTSVLSDDALMLFRLRADQAGAFRVVLTNNRNQRFEGQRHIQLAQ